VLTVPITLLVNAVASSAALLVLARSMLQPIPPGGPQLHRQPATPSAPPPPAAANMAAPAAASASGAQLYSSGRGLAPMAGPSLQAAARSAHGRPRTGQRQVRRCCPTLPHTRVDVYVYRCNNVHIRTYTYMHIYIHICTYVYMYIHFYTYIHI
jgi:hypothetical protein